MHGRRRGLRCSFGNPAMARHRGPSFCRETRGWRSMVFFFRFSCRNHSYIARRNRERERERSHVAARGRKKIECALSFFISADTHQLVALRQSVFGAFVDRCAGPLMYTYTNERARARAFSLALEYRGCIARRPYIAPLTNVSLNSLREMRRRSCARTKCGSSRVRSVALVF